MAGCSGAAGEHRAVLAALLVPVCPPETYPSADRAVLP